MLFTDSVPLPLGFEVSPLEWARGERYVPISDLTRLVEVETMCSWNGQKFLVGIIDGGIANVYYKGTDFDTVAHLPGMTRPDKYEVIGQVPVAELNDVRESVEEVPLDAPDGNRREI